MVTGLRDKMIHRLLPLESMQHFSVLIVSYWITLKEMSW